MIATDDFSIFDAAEFSVFTYSPTVMGIMNKCTKMQLYPDEVMPRDAKIDYNPMLLIAREWTGYYDKEDDDEDGIILEAKML